MSELRVLTTAPRQMGSANPLLDAVVERHRDEPLRRTTVLTHGPLKATAWRANLRARGCDRVEVLALPAAYDSRVPLEDAVVFVDTVEPGTRRQQPAAGPTETGRTGMAAWLATAAEVTVLTQTPLSNPTYAQQE